MATIAFDFDGTIANSMPLLEDLAVHVLRGSHSLTEGAIRALYRWSSGRPFDEQLTVMFKNGSRLLAAEFAEAKPQIYDRVPPCLDAPLALNRIRSAGDLLVIITSTTADLVTDWLTDHELTHYVDHVIGFEPGYGKADHLRIAGADVFMGDSDYDEETARQAGVKFIRAHAGGSRHLELESGWYVTT